MDGAAQEVGSSAALPSGDVTFLLTDVEGSTDLLKRIGDIEYALRMQEVVQLQRAEGERDGGVLVGVEGDACFFAFPSPSSALDACAAMQDALARSVARKDPIRVRMGLARGREVQPSGDNYATLAVHHAARVSAAANGGQVLLTAEVAEADPGRCVDLGLFTVRDFDGPVRLYALSRGDEPVRRPRVPTTGTDTFPLARTSFVGRHNELLAVRKAIGDYRLVTLLGPGGAGKTRLAAQAVRDESWAFGATWFVDLSTATDREMVMDAVRAALADLGSTVPTSEPAAAIAKLLAGARAIVILDNCEQVLDDCATFVDELLSACPSLTVLCTSREPLALPDERLIQLLGLSLPEEDTATSLLASDAGRLFVDRIEHVAAMDLDVDAPAAAALVRLLDGLPLALELVAAMAWQYPLTELAPLVAAQLDDAAGSTVVRGRPKRHGSLRAVIAWSVKQLSPTERAALAALAIPVPPIARRTVRAALRPLSADGDPTETTIAALARRSLLVESSDDGSVSMLVTIRAYAATIDDSEAHRDGVLAALLDDCLDALGDPRVASARSPDRTAVAPTALELVECEDLPAASRQRLAWAVTPYLRTRSPTRAGAHLKRALELDATDVDLRVRMLVDLAASTRPEDLTDLDTARALLPRTTDPRVEEDYWRGWCDVWAFRGLGEPVLEVADRYLASATDGRASWLSARALALQNCGRIDEAEAATLASIEAAAAELGEQPPPEERLNIANLVGIHGDPRRGLALAREILPGIVTDLQAAQCIDIIATALSRIRLTVESRALTLWSNNLTDTLGFNTAAVDKDNFQQLAALARNGLSVAERKAAEKLAGGLDVDAARNLAMRLAAAELADDEDGLS